MQTMKEAASVFLANKRIAVTGVSRSAKDHGANTVFKRLRDRGYDVRIPETIHNRPRLFVRDPFDNLLELVEIRGQYE